MQAPLVNCVMLDPDQRPGLVGVSVGPYTIEALIDQGGMGTVYRATHTRLGHSVAVKCLHEHLLTHPEARERFIREPRLASRVAHPYVASVIDCIDYENRILLVMEYVDGRPLTRVLLDARQEPRDVLRWAQEITEALASIHRSGLVHRDLKPANVMLTREGHIKVLDFGLARQMVRELASDDPTATAEATLTRDGAQPGTLVYMAPEQLRGERVDQRTDLFSLGILLYEVFTQTHPFLRGSPMASVSAILNEPPSGGMLPTDALHQAVSKVLDRLLEKAPAARYQSAAEVLEDLRALALPDPGRERASILRILTAAGLVLTILVLGLGATGYWWLQRPPVWNEPRFAIGIAPFEDPAGSVDSVAGQLVADLVAIDLSASSLARTVGPAQTRSLLINVRSGSGPDVQAAAIQTAFSVDYVLMGKLFREGSRLLATVDLSSRVGGAPALPPVRAEGDSYLELAERISTAVRRHLPDVPLIKALQDDHVTIAEVMTQSDEAQQSFQQGVLFWSREQQARAIAAFEAAVAADPGFAAAYAGLAEALYSCGYGQRARQAATTAVATVPSGSSRALHRLRLTAEAIRERAFGRVAAEVEVASRLAGLFPDDPELMRRHAEALLRDAKPAEALAKLDLVLAAEPGNVRARVLRIQALRRLERYDDALADAEGAFEHLSALNNREGLAAVEFERGRIHWFREDFASARLHFAAAAAGFLAVGREISAADALLEQAKLETSLGRNADAETQFSAAMSYAERNGDLAMQSDAFGFRGYNHAVQGDFSASEIDLRRALDMARQLENAVLMMDPLANLAGILVYLGRIEEARPLLAEAAAAAADLGRTDVEVATRINLAMIDVRLGNLNQALANLDELTSAEGAGSADQTRTRAYLSRATTCLLMGRPAEALRATTLAIETYRRLDVPGDLARALLIRGEAYSVLGDTARADADLAAAREIIDAPEADLGDLEELAELKQAGYRFQRGESEQALRYLNRAVGDPAGSAGDVEARLLLCRASSQLHARRSDRGRRACEAVAEDESLPLPHRVIARAYLGETMLLHGKVQEADTLAREVFEAATGMGLRLAAVQAALTLQRTSAALETDLDPRFLEFARTSLQAFESEAAGVQELTFVPSEELKRYWREIR